jgi:hypothetical protein
MPLVVAWIALVWIPGGVIPFTESGMTIETSSGELRNRVEAYSILATLLIVPSTLASGFFVGWWCRRSRDFSRHTFGLKDLFIMVGFIAVLTLCVISIGRAFFAILENVTNK